MPDDTMTASTTGWQLAGNAAAAYEQFLVPAIFEPMARRLVDVSGVRPGQHVLDAACGTGVVGRAAARRMGATGRVTGVDCSPQMLEVARAATAEWDATFDWHRADLLDLPFDDAIFDVALCEEAVQFLDDPVAGLAELARVTRPGGRVAFSVLRSLDHHAVYAMFVAALRDHAGQAAAAMMSSPFGFGDRNRCRAVAEAAGLVDVVVRTVVAEERFGSIADFVQQEAASSPLADELAGLDDGRRAALVAEMEDRLASHLDDLGLVFGNATRIVVGHVPG